jgi:hypothetical protein
MCAPPQRTHFRTVQARKLRKTQGVSQATKQHNSLLRRNFLLWVPTANLQSVAV